MTDQPDWGRLIREGRAKEFVEQLHAGVERAKQVEAARPSWDQLAEALLDYRIAVYVTVLNSDGDPLSPIGLQAPAPGCELLAEVASLTKRRLNPGHALLQQQLQAYAGVLVDEIGGLAALMLADQPVRPALVISRVLLDAGAQVMYLLDPSISAEERTVRAANIRLDGLAAELEDLRGTPDPECEAEELRGEMNAVWEDGASDGLQRTLSSSGVERRHFSPAPPKAGAMTAYAAAELGPQMWRLLSSVVHLQDRTVVQFISGRGDVAQTVQGRKYGAIYTAAGVIAATESLGRLASFCGLDGSLLAERAGRLRALWNAASGADDER